MSDPFKLTCKGCDNEWQHRGFAREGYVCPRCERWNYEIPLATTKFSAEMLGVEADPEFLFKVIDGLERQVQDLRASHREMRKKLTE